jgi:hypothetical protein
MTGSRTPFTANLRSRPGLALRLGEPGQSVITVRVQVPEVWDVIRVETPLSEPVLSLKVRALEALYPAAEYHDQFVVKLNGFEVLDENTSIADTGATDGSIFLVTHRRKRAVR